MLAGVYVVENPLPTLVLGRMTPPTSTDEAIAVAREVRAIVSRNAPARTAILGDFRITEAVPQAFAETFLQLMRHDNDNLLCSGVLFNAGTPAASQLLAVLQAAGGSEWRHATSDRNGLFSWFSSRVTTMELKAIKSFVATGDAITSA